MNVFHCHWLFFESMFFCGIPSYGYLVCFGYLGDGREDLVLIINNSSSGLMEENSGGQLTSDFGFRTV